MPACLASVRPISLGCALPSKPPLVDGQKIFTIGSPLGEDKDTITGSASRVDAHAAVSDFRLALDDTGGPVFAADGAVVGITSFMDEKERNRRDDSRVVRVDEACEVFASAEKKLKDAVGAERSGSSG